jgi:hypothetical protein
MENTSTLPSLLILQLLKLIEQCDKNIVHLLETGSDSKSFAIKQEKFLLKKYCSELNEIVKQNYREVEFKIISKSAKAA